MGLQTGHASLIRIAVNCEHELCFYTRLMRLMQRSSLLVAVAAADRRMEERREGARSGIVPQDFARGKRLAFMFLRNSEFFISTSISRRIFQLRFWSLPMRVKAAGLSPNFFSNPKTGLFHHCWELLLLSCMWRSKSRGRSRTRLVPQYSWGILRLCRSGRRMQ
jgi:hypothetical protein